jgi:Fe-S cluster biosynthesis and repair protein YggX
MPAARARLWFDVAVHGPCIDARQQRPAGCTLKAAVMARMVKCVKLQRELPGMPFKPFNDALGERIYNEISMEAWKMWLEHSKMIVNEYRLDLTSADAHQKLKEQCEQFLFGEGAALPPDYVPPPAK